MRNGLTSKWLLRFLLGLLLIALPAGLPIDAAAPDPPVIALDPAVIAPDPPVIALDPAAVDAVSDRVSRCIGPGRCAGDPAPAVVTSPDAGAGPAWSRQGPGSAASAQARESVESSCAGKPDGTPCACGGAVDSWCYTVLCARGQCQQVWKDPECVPPDDCSFSFCHAHSPEPAPYCSFWCEDVWTAAPGIIGTLTVAKNGGAAVLSWARIHCGAAHDIVRGSIALLHGSRGDFTQSTNRCLVHAQWAVTFTDPDPPGAGGGFWYAVRAMNGNYNGSYDEGGPGQVGMRDPGINSSMNACP